MCQPYIHIYIYIQISMPSLSLSIYIYIIYEPINLHIYIYIYVHLHILKVSAYIYTHIPKPQTVLNIFLHIRIPYQMLGTDPIYNSIYIHIKPKPQTLKCPEPKLQSAVNVDDTCVWGEAQRRQSQLKQLKDMPRCRARCSRAGLVLTCPHGRITRDWRSF